MPLASIFLQLAFMPPSRKRHGVYFRYLSAADTSVRMHARGCTHSLARSVARVRGARVLFHM